MALWLGYNSRADFTSVTFAPQQILASFGVGGGGLTVVNNLFTQAQKSEALQLSADAILRLEDAIERLGEQRDAAES